VKGLVRPKPVHLAQLNARVVRGPRADGRWYWRICTAGGAGKEVAVGSGWWTRDEAAKAMASSVAGVAVSLDSHGVLVRDVLELYLGAVAERPNGASSTLVTYTNFAKHINRLMGQFLAQQLSRRDLEEYVRTRLGEHAGSPQGRRLPRFVSPQSVEAEIAFLRGAVRWAGENGVLEDGTRLPYVRVRPTKEPVPARNMHTPSIQDVTMIINYLAVTRGWLCWTVVALTVLRETGLRVGEAKSLRWSSLDMAARKLSVFGKVGHRLLPMSDGLHQFFSKLREARPAEPPEQHIVREGVLGRSDLGTRIIHAAGVVGVRAFSPQGIRRAVVQALYRTGADPGIAGAILGHSPEVALRHYRQATFDEQAAALNLALRAAGSQPPSGDPVTNPVTVTVEFRDRRD
jgi:integrase